MFNSRYKIVFCCFGRDRGNIIVTILKKAKPCYYSLITVRLFDNKITLYSDCRGGGLTMDGGFGTSNNVGMAFGFNFFQPSTRQASNCESSKCFWKKCKECYIFHHSFTAINILTVNEMYFTQARSRRWCPLISTPYILHPCCSPDTPWESEQFISFFGPVATINCNAARHFEMSICPLTTPTIFKIEKMRKLMSMFYNAHNNKYNII